MSGHVELSIIGEGLAFLILWASGSCWVRVIDLGFAMCGDGVQFVYRRVYSWCFQCYIYVHVST